MIKKAIWLFHVIVAIDRHINRNSRLVAATFALVVASCASKVNNNDLADPLEQRLLAREDKTLQNLLASRVRAGGSTDAAAGSSYWNGTYDGPAVEPPLPDLNLLPEDLPQWDENPSTAESPSPAPDASPAQTPDKEPHA